MTAELALLTLVRAHLAASIAILVVMAARGPARRLLGSEFTYGLWMLAPTAAVASLFPTLAEFRGAPAPAEHVSALLGVGLPSAGFSLALWGAGAAATAALFAAAELRFRRLAARGLAGPAVMGLCWPRVVVPADYEARFDGAERRFIRQHERAHIARRDPQANAFIAAMQVLGWFNPLIHLAAGAARLDQEIACDAAVVDRRPAIRRPYAATLLKAHLSGPRSVLACAWAATARHPLETRILMLNRPSPSLAQYLMRAGTVLACTVATAVAVWALAPQSPPL